jgi:DNA-directed RNA polymerase specialized sigma24 family protein
MGENPAKSESNSESDKKPRGSVTGWIAGLKGGDEEAAQRILERYFDQIVDVARRRIGIGQLEVADEEDVAIEAFASVFKAAALGRLTSLRDRYELWGLLVTTAYRKMCDYWRKLAAQKRDGSAREGASTGKGPVFGHPRLGLDDVAVQTQSAGFLAAVADQHTYLMGVLQSKGKMLPEIATKILEGYTNREIAVELGCSQRRVERKRAIIRDLWTHAVGESS